MHATSLSDGTWSSVLSRISATVDLEETARRFGALRRVRKIRHASDLLRLGLIYGPGQSSLRTTAALAGDAHIADISDKAVLGRLRRCGDWFAHILACLMAQERGESAPEPTDALELALVDGSVICGPASKGTDWRLHARFDPGRGCFGDLKLSRATLPERVDHTKIEPGQTVIQDRGYARVRDFKAVLTAGSDFITRIGWRALRLFDDDGSLIDLFCLLPDDDRVHEHTVHMKAVEQPLRLVIQRIPPEKAEQQRKRVKRKASKAGHQLDGRTEIAAGFLFLITSLPAARQPAERVVSLYRQRWQVELGFKRLKTIGGLDKLPAMDPDLARTWLLAHLIAAVLTDEIAQEIVGFSPSDESFRPAGIIVEGLDHRPPVFAHRDLTPTQAPAAQ